jgi:hypothetical protein
LSVATNVSQLHELDENQVKFTDVRREKKKLEKKFEELQKELEQQQKELDAKG